MKRFIVKRLETLLLVAMAPLILTSCIETEQHISYKDGWYHYDCRFAVDKSLGLFFDAEEGPFAFADIDAEERELRREFQEHDDEIRVDIRKIDDYTVDMAISIYRWTTSQELRDLLPKKENEAMRIPLATNRLAWMATQEFFQDSQQSEEDRAVRELLLSDYHWTISVEESILPYRVSKAYLTDEAWESTQVDCEWFGNRLIVKIPMTKFIDGANYTQLYIY